MSTDHYLDSLKIKKQRKKEKITRQTGRKGRKKERQMEEIQNKTKQKKRNKTEEKKRRMLQAFIMKPYSPQKKELSLKHDAKAKTKLDSTFTYQ